MTPRSLAGERPTLSDRQRTAYELGVMDRKLKMDWEDCPFNEDDDLCDWWEKGFEGENFEE